MNTKNNQRSRQTEALMQNAYMALMNEKPTGKITVKDVCERAGINRGTFYLHYNEPNDILIELEDDALVLFRNALFDIGAIEKPSEPVLEYMIALLDNIRANGDLFRTLLVENSDPHFRRKLRDTSLRMIENAFALELPAEQKNIVFFYIISGSLEVVTEWIRGGFSASERMVCETLFELCEGGLRTVCI